MSIDVKKAFTLPFSDPKWPQKLVILFALLALNNFVNVNSNPKQFHPEICLFSVLAIITSFYGNGYILQYAQNEIKNKNGALPEWDNINKYFINSLILGFVGFIYALPIFLLVIPIIISSAARNAGLLPITLISGLLLFVYLLVFWFISPYVSQSYIENYNFNDAFKIGKIFDLIFSNFGDYLISGVVSIVTFIILMIPYAVFGKSIIGIVIFAIFTPYYGLITNNLFAQAYRESKYPVNKEIQTSEG